MKLSETRERGTVSVSILAMILHYNFVKCYHWEKPGKLNKEFLCIISSDCIINSIFKKYVRPIK